VEPSPATGEGDRVKATGAVTTFSVREKVHSPTTGGRVGVSRNLSRAPTVPLWINAASLALRAGRQPGRLHSGYGSRGVPANRAELV